MSSSYFDKYLFESDPVLLDAVAAHLGDLLPPSTEVLAGLELGGVPVATALSLRMGLPVAFVRKAAKPYWHRRAGFVITHAARAASAAARRPEL